ncbi:MAG TPA: hypothetical protein DCS66_00755 [Flavobacteriaceae bacterium]|jgi:hypothetical protein|nr:hypothetical protein [Flavobacteriaceae bacterium]|tara:strand:+ start:541 stop:912 length:372 start_codon:yes stop_codon:yes gene_type:complete
MKILKILTLTALLSGCSLLDSRFTPPEVKPVEIVTIEKAAPVYHPPLPNQITAMPVEWRVLTPDTMAEYLADLEKGEAPAQAYYGLTNKGYENLSNNMGEVKRYIRQLLSINKYYRSLDKEKE